MPSLCGKKSKPVTFAQKQGASPMSRYLDFRGLLREQGSGVSQIFNRCQRPGESGQNLGSLSIAAAV